MPSIAFGVLKQDINEVEFSPPTPAPSPMGTYSMADFGSATKPAVADLPSYRTVASDEIELDGNADHQQRHHLTWHIKGRTYHNYRVRDENLWNTTWRQMKLVPWKWMVYRFCSHILPVITIIGLIVLLAIMSLPGFIESSTGSLCQPDGTFDLSYDDYTPWKRDAIFAINMGYGSYSFGVAKLIDVSWDVAVGRGGQAVLAIFTYKAFTKALSRTMESSSVSNETFEAMTLQNDTIFGVLKLMRDFLKIGGTRAKVAMFWTILAALFVLLVPTWLSAMTGYTSDISGFVQDNNNNLVPAEDFLPAIYIIHDGDRLGQPYTKDYVVAIPWNSGSSTYLDSTNYYGCTLGYRMNYTTEKYYWSDQSNKNCTLLWRLSEYTSIYGLLGLNATESQFTFPNGTNITITEPSLNVSGHFASNPHYASSQDYYRSAEWYAVPYGLGWKRNDTGTMPFAESGPVFYHQTSNTGYDLTQFNENGSCQQLSDVRYKWGFSFLLLYVFIATWLIWTIVTYGLYLDAYLHSRLDVTKRTMGLERAVLDLSQAMQKKVDAETVELYGNHQLKHLISSGYISYQDLLLDSLPPTRWTQLRRWWRDFRFGPWAKAEKWWLAAMLVFDLFFILSFTVAGFSHGWSYYFSALPGFGVFLVLIVGRQVPGRWLIFVFWFLLFWIGNIWWIDMRRKSG